MPETNTENKFALLSDVNISQIKLYKKISKIIQNFLYNLISEILTSLNFFVSCTLSGKGKL